VGPYELVSLLGKGAFGEVWRARDTSLNRDVALKILRHDDPEDIKRFLREAQTAASLSHPNIAAVYETRDNYIAMQLIEGQTLQTFPRHDTAAVVRILRDAVRAVAFAHTKGVIHRDLKPANIMVDHSGRVFVMDFGLARQIRPGSSLTISGVMVGTPAYMSPEQARAQRADDRSDIYSLGATLYELLADRPPFQSDDMVSLLARVVADDPAPVRRRRPHIARELDTIVMKCLEKDPERRYLSTTALADDLDRFLAGEPISAHPPSTFYLLRKRFARRKAVVITAALGLAALIALAAVLLPMLRSTEQRLSQAQLALRDQMRELTDAYLKTALALRKSGDLKGMLECVPKAEKVCRECAEKLPRLSEPHTRLGRIYRAAMRFDEALAEQDKALLKDPDDLDARYERGVLRLNDFIAAVLRAIRIGARDPDAAEAPHDLTRMRGAVRDHPDVRRVGRLMASDLARVDSAVARALLAFAEFQAPMTSDALEEAVRREPNREEAWLWLAALTMSEGDLARTDAVITRALEHHRGFLPLLSLRAGVRARQAAAPGAPDGAFNAALADVDDLLSMDPASDDGLETRGKIRLMRAEARRARGEDQREDVKLAIADLRACRDPDATLCRALSTLADAEADAGGDPEPITAEALAAADDAVRRLPDAYAFHIRGVARGNAAVHRSRAGLDVRALFASAVADLDEALRRAPFSAAELPRGRIRVKWARHDRSRGADTAELLDAAVADFGLMAARPDLRRRALVERAHAHLERAYASRADPSPHWAAALDDVDAALSADEGNAEAWCLRGDVLVERAARLKSAPTFAEAVAAFEKAVERSPRASFYWARLGFARALLAMLSPPEAAKPIAERAVADATRAIELAPRWFEAWSRRGHVHKFARRYDAAIADFEKAAELNPPLRSAFQREIDACRRAPP